MYKDSRHPTRKCGKCKLNFRDHCGLFADPHQMWSRNRKCPGHLSAAHYQQYAEQQEKLQVIKLSKPSTFARRELTKARQTASGHRDGRYVLGRRTG